MFRRDEIENVLTGFTASIMNLISQYRQKRDAENQVPFFVNAVEGERARMANKFEALRSDAGPGGLTADQWNERLRDVGIAPSARPTFTTLALASR
jgi:hypothetical protein